MIKRTLMSLGAVVPFLFLGAPLMHAQGVNCSINNGFATLTAVIPDTVGGCLMDPHMISNGNTVQQTVGGLLSYNPADNLPEFTDGNTTWVIGPQGLQSRPNDQRFSYEAPETQVAGVTITNQPSANVVGCLNAAVSADGLAHPVSVVVTLPAGNASC